MKKKNFSKENEPGFYKTAADDQEIQRMNEIYMENYKFLRQSKINRALLFLAIIFFVGVVVKNYFF